MRLCPLQLEQFRKTSSNGSYGYGRYTYRDRLSPLESVSGLLFNFRQSLRTHFQVVADINNPANRGLLQ